MKEVSAPGAPLAAYRSYLYQARCAAQMGDNATSAADWDQARDAATSQSNALPELAAYAIKLNLYQEARKTLIRMTKVPAQAKGGYLAPLQLEASQGTSDDLLETPHQMTIDFPADPEPKNDWSYLSLLLNRNIDAATQTAEDLVQDHPELLSYRSILVALGRLRHNDPAGAARVYDQLQIDWAGRAASWKMIYATVLAAQGRKSEGLALVWNVTANQLRPAEPAFFKTYFPGT